MQLSFSQKPNSSDQTETGQLQKDSLPGLPKVVAARCAKARHAQHAQPDGSKNYTNNLLCQTLTPLTLELGGKSPAFVDAGCGHREAWIRLSSDMLRNIAKEITETKVFKSGQFCCAHDYVGIPGSLQRKW
ncbi:unnamed protein product [Durusdinium trenchii]|uniref:Uncharacterized protein n=1 Tax=Durusdinium trenchii TaxID=1381693 RepID=A0ABP0HCU8_9DINO